jgi:Fic-DOC domain mobile mystery protein B
MPWSRNRAVPPQTGFAPSGPSPITDGERSRLIPSLSTRGQLEEIERMSIHAARVWAMRAAASNEEQVLTEEFSRELHRRMFAGIWRGAGRYRTAREDAGWDPEKIPEGMRMILDDAEGWLRFATYPVHEAAVRLHHRIRCVRPWSDGNGNHARLMADVLVASQQEEPLTWGLRSCAGQAPKARERYREATRAADRGDMAPLLEFARS